MSAVPVTRTLMTWSLSRPLRSYSAAMSAFTRSRMWSGESRSTVVAPRRARTAIGGTVPAAPVRRRPPAIRWSPRAPAGQKESRQPRTPPHPPPAPPRAAAPRAPPGPAPPPPPLLLGGERPPLAGRQPAVGDRADPDPHQALDRVPHRLEHPPDLPVAPSWMVMRTTRRGAGWPRPACARPRARRPRGAGATRPG